MVWLIWVVMCRVHSLLWWLGLLCRVCSLVRRLGLHRTHRRLLKLKVRLGTGCSQLWNRNGLDPDHTHPRCNYRCRSSVSGETLKTIAPAVQAKLHCYRWSNSLWWGLHMCTLNFLWEEPVQEHNIQFLKVTENSFWISRLGNRKFNIWEK